METDSEKNQPNDALLSLQTSRYRFKKKITADVQSQLRRASRDAHRHHPVEGHDKDVIKTEVKQQGACGQQRHGQLRPPHHQQRMLRKYLDCKGRSPSTAAVSLPPMRSFRSNKGCCWGFKEFALAIVLLLASSPAPWRSDSSNNLFADAQRFYYGQCPRTVPTAPNFDLKRVSIDPLCNLCRTDDT